MADAAQVQMPPKPIVSDEEARLMDYPDSTEEIPVLDIAPVLAGEPGALQAFATRLRDVTETIGFFYLKGHGIPQDLVDRMFAECRRFHALPAEVKATVAHRYTDSFQSGYVAPATPRPKAANVDIIDNIRPNLLAKFLVTRELPKDDPAHKTMNVWPADLPGFRETVSEYQGAVEKLARSFLPVWATALNMPADHFEPYFRAPHLTLSMLHYPPQKEIGNRQYGLAPHTDNSFMTFLPQSNVGGLAVRMPSGHWRLVDKIPGTFLINTGNVIMRWTNDRFLSTKHRVINTAEVDRYALPTFFGPSGDAMIECIPTCVSPDRPVRHEPMTYRQLREWYYGLRV